jgi:hypothetical protein
MQLGLIWFIGGVEMTWGVPSLSRRRKVENTITMAEQLNLYNKHLEAGEYYSGVV